jgi:Fe-S oxidoreductase
MLHLAQRYLRRTLAELQPHIEAGVPMVGLEPSCVAVFRDELGNLFPHDLDAQRLGRQTFTLAELLVDHTPGYTPPRLARHALVQRHCHHQAVMGFDEDKELLGRVGLDADIPDSGCCGMAGSFGYEAGEHYDVSMACGERVLLPAVRAASTDTVLMADGFSCREQISQSTSRRALHVAEVLRMAMDQRDGGPAPGPYPERFRDR